MAPARTMTGARAQLIVTDPKGVGKVVGIFSNVSWGMALDVQDIYILGRYSAAETVYTAHETVNVSATGYRVVGAGAHVSARVPNLSELMNHEYLQLSIFDRQTNVMTAKIHQVRPTGYTTSVNARGVEEITINFRGILVDEENITNAESAGFSDLT